MTGSSRAVRETVPVRGKKFDNVAKNSPTAPPRLGFRDTFVTRKSTRLGRSVGHLQLRLARVDRYQQRPQPRGREFAAGRLLAEDRHLRAAVERRQVGKLRW